MELSTNLTTNFQPTIVMLPVIVHSFSLCFSILSLQIKRVVLISTVAQQREISVPWHSRILSIYEESKAI